MGINFLYFYTSAFLTFQTCYPVRVAIIISKTKRRPNEAYAILIRHLTINSVMSSRTDPGCLPYITHIHPHTHTPKCNNIMERLETSINEKCGT